MQKKDGTETAGAGRSVIPAVSAEEDRIAEELEHARAEAERKTSDAQQAAEIRIRESESDLHATVTQHHTNAFERIASEARAARKDADREAAALADKGRANMSRAVDFILSRALGGARDG